MNKTIKAIGVAAAVGLAPLVSSAQLEVLDELEGEVFFAFESEYSFRGVKLAGPSVQPGFELSLMGLYGGVWHSTDIKDGGEVETDYYVGLDYDVEDLVNIDLGVTFYTFPEDEDTTEIFLGFAPLADVIIDPALYLYYDFDLEDFTVELQLGHGIDLGEGFGLDLGVDLGYVFADDSDDDYFYYVGIADIVYNLSDTTTFSVGGRVAGNDNDDLPGPDNQLWWGAALTTSF